MNEQFLQYIWKYNLWKQSEARLSTGEPVSIINQGLHNFDSGPDFVNAQVKLGDQIWAGNIEVHLKSSDWYQHKHNTDRAYDNVVVQVVYKHDKEVVNSSGRAIPSLEIKFDEKLLNNYKQLIESERWVACEDYIYNINSIVIKQFITSLTIQRLERKTQQLNLLFQETNNNLAQTLFISIARSIGTKLNSVPFELLAKSIPLTTLVKYRNEPMIIEALLFGLSGLLNDSTLDDSYFDSLKKEFEFQKRKYSLVSIEKHLWKYLRNRPKNFPTIRIAQLANFVTINSHNLIEIVEIDDLNRLKKLFDVSTSKYWEAHYRFGVESQAEIKRLGNETIDLIMINSVIPFIFAYGKWKNDDKYCDRAIEFLEQIKTEKNTIIENWQKRKLKASNAFESQGLIELKNEYCQKRRCLDCVVGSKLIVA